MKTENPERPGTSGSYSRNLVSSASTRSVPAILPSHDFVLDRHNLGLVRPRKLTPLEGLSKTGQIRIGKQNFYIIQYFKSSPFSNHHFLEENLEKSHQKIFRIVY